MPIEYQFHMRRVPPPRRQIPRDYARFIKAIAGIEDGYWQVKQASIPVVRKAKGEFHHFISLTRSYRFKNSCTLAYLMPSRTPVPDYQASDDYFDIEFRPDQEFYAEFVAGVVQKYIAAFDPHLAHCGPADLAVEDFDTVHALNKRKSIYRIFPIYFASEALVRSSFGLSCSAFAKRVRPRCDAVEVFHGGVLVLTRRLLSVEESNAFSRKVLRHLPPPKVHAVD